MGAAISSNSASVASSISNTVKNSTVISQQQSQTAVNNINLQGCTIDAAGKVTFTIQQSAYQRNQQTSAVQATTSLKNTASQSAVQAATSKMGSLGIGFAEASNSVNMMANISNTIVNTVSNAQSSIQSASNNIECNNTSITAGGNVSFSISSSQQLYDKMAFTNSDVTDVTNKISQTVKQTAAATVQGPAAALLAAAVLVVAIGWAIGNVETGGAASEIGPLIFAIVVITIVILIFCAWYFSWWPFFNKLIPCTPAVPTFKGLGVPQDRCTACVVSSKTPKPVKVPAPPIKYIFPLFDTKPNPGTPTIDNTKWKIGNIASIIGTDPQIPINPPPEMATSLWDLCISANATPGALLGPTKDNPNGAPYTAGTMNNAGYNIETLINSHQSIAKYNKLLQEFYATGPTDPILNAVCEIILGKGKYASQASPIPPMLIDPTNSLPSTIPSTGYPNDTFPMPSKKPTFIAIPDQYLWSSSGVGTNTGPTGATNENNVVMGSCTPRAFFWTGSTSKCWSADGTSNPAQCNPWDGGWIATGSQGKTSGACYVAGSWSYKSGSNFTPGYGTTTPNNALASSNLPAFGEWIFNTAAILAKDPNVTSKAGQLESADVIAQNVMCGFVRTMLTHILNSSDAGGTAKGPYKFLQRDIANNSMLTGLTSIAPELMVITIPTADPVAYILTEKTPNADSAKAQTLWNILVGSSAKPLPGASKAPTTIAEFMSNNIIYYTPDTTTGYNFTCTLTGPGTMKMVEGVCHNKNWEIQNFMLNIGNYIFLFIILVALAYLAKILFSKKK